MDSTNGQHRKARVATLVADEKTVRQGELAERTTYMYLTEIVE